MKFIFPQNYKFNKKILGLIDYQTALLNIIWGGIVFLIINRKIKPTKTILFNYFLG